MAQRDILMMKRLRWPVSALALLTMQSYQEARAVPQTSDVATRATVLYCTHGGVGIRPQPLPPGYEIWFAVVVVELDSQREIANAAVSDFALLDSSGRETKSKRVVEIDVFERRRTAAEGELAYYLNRSDTHPWSGVLPAGRIRLRIRVAFVEEPTTGSQHRFRFRFGGNLIEGEVKSRWPT